MSEQDTDAFGNKFDFSGIYDFSKRFATLLDRASEAAIFLSQNGFELQSYILAKAIDDMRNWKPPLIK